MTGARESLEQLIAAIDAGSVQLASADIDPGPDTLNDPRQPYPWHEEWLARARSAIKEGADAESAGAELSRRHDVRVTELLAANNVFEQRARVAEREIKRQDRIIAALVKIVGEVGEIDADEAILLAEGKAGTDQRLPHWHVVAPLIEALRPFAETWAAWSKYDPEAPEGMAVMRASTDHYVRAESGACPTVADLKRAHAALSYAVDEVSPSWQARVLDWAVDKFGAVARDPQERALRFLEEAIELGQASELRRMQIELLVERVYSREPGDPRKEMAQAGLTLEALVENLGLSLAALIAAEVARIESIPKEEWQRRHQAKVDAGHALPNVVEA